MQFGAAVRPVEPAIRCKSTIIFSPDDCKAHKAILSVHGQRLSTKADKCCPVFRVFEASRARCGLEFLRQPSFGVAL